MTGDDLRDFAGGKVFPYLAGFKQRTSQPNTIEYKIGEVFGEIKNKVQSVYDLREQNFSIRTGETAFLFLQHFIKTLKAGGRAAIVIQNTFLSNTDNASTSLRKLLLESCNLHTVLDCPGGTFQGAGVKTVVLFFETGAPTRKVWFYQPRPGRSMRKTNSLNDGDMVDFIERQKSFADSAQSWSMEAGSIDTGTYDLSVKNPNGGDEIALRTPQDILDEIAALDAESAGVLATIRELVM